jgi:hypothetical protein
MSVANTIQKGDFDLNVVSIRKPLEFADGSKQDTAYTGGAGLPTLEEILTSGDDAQNLNIVGVNTLEVTNQIELTPTGNVVNFVGEINQVALGVTFTGNQLQPTIINSNSGQSTAVALTICDNVGGDGLEILPNATNNAKNPIVQAGDIVLSATSATQSLAITSDSATTNGLRITDTSVVVGAGGTGDNPTNYTQYVGTGTVEHGQSHQFINGVAQYDAVGNANRIIPSMPSLTATSIPSFELRTVQVAGTAGTTFTDKLVTLAHNVLASTNYTVFVSIYFGDTGSGGTYNLTNTSTAITTPLIVHSITATDFKVYFQHTSGDNLNIVLSCLITYNTIGSNFLKSYT